MYKISIQDPRSSLLPELLSQCQLKGATFASFAALQHQNWLWLFKSWPSPFSSVSSIPASPPRPVGRRDWYLTQHHRRWSARERMREGVELQWFNLPWPLEQRSFEAGRKRGAEATQRRGPRLDQRRRAAFEELLNKTQENVFFSKRKEETYQKIFFYIKDLECSILSSNVETI